MGLCMCVCVCEFVVFMICYLIISILIYLIVSIAGPATDCSLNIRAGGPAIGHPASMARGSFSNFNE